MRPFFTLFSVTVLFSCSVSRNYNPNRKYSREELQQDYTLLRKILEKNILLFIGTHQKTVWIIFLTRDSRLLRIR